MTTLTPVPSEVTRLQGPRPRSDEWAVVLGASSGMGAAVARRLAAEGMNILGVHLDTAAREDQVALLVDELECFGGDVVFTNANAASEATRSQVVDQLCDLNSHAGVGLLFHSLAFGSLVPYLPLRDEDDGPRAALLSSKQMTMTLEVMAHSLVWWTRDLIEADLLGPGSHVIAMTSAGDSRVSRSYGAVSAAKSALLSHVRQLAVEAAPFEVAVNAIRAGVTLTPSFARIPGCEELSRIALGANPHGRLTTPEDVADAVAMLTSSRSCWVTGNVIGADGGEGLTT